MELPQRDVIIKFLLDISGRTTELAVALKAPEDFKKKMHCGNISMDINRMLCYIQTGSDPRHELPDLGK